MKTLAEWQEKIRFDASQGDGRLLQLSRGLVTIVDHTWYDELASMGKWSAFDARGFFYAGKKVSGKLVMMARHIIQPRGKMIADHKDGNTLDNRTENLRELTKTQNRQNKHSLESSNASGTEGVWFSPSQNKWLAYITRNGTRHHLGSFADKTEAISARTQAILLLTGEDICQTSSLLQNNIKFLKQQETQKKA